MSLLLSKVSSLLPRLDVVNTATKLNLGSLFHTSSVVDASSGPKNFVRYNKEMFPIQQPGEEKRPAFVCHIKKNIRYSPKKMWYVATFVRGMSVDEAIKQLNFCLKKGATAVKETILEAQEMAVKQHNVEYKTNLWVAESFCTKGTVIKGIRRHAKMRIGIVRYMHCHYFVRLEEGKPPEDYYFWKTPKPPKEQLEAWVTKMRKRKIVNSL